uniref:Killer cell lectin-like receptor subfamily F member 1 isoform X2 n=1 Tax=Tursiops truncatus TaxID=9739 RepID=A0A6J3S8W4_TURTR|nr:killer cell lectin-like receptor subfamily F member 1 isoform X2 [Tursiops truncatus]
MAGDIIYADIKHSSSEHSSSRQRSDSHHHGIFLKVECAMIIILLVIVIVLSIFGCFNSSTASKSCPSEDWKLHGGKCYWVAKSEKSWNESKNDCVMKNSHLMVIQDFIDMSFLWRNLQASASYWVGLRIPPGEELWTWVDNSTFDPQLFSEKKKKPRTRSMKCVLVSYTEITEESCEKHHQWICQL